MIFLAINKHQFSYFSKISSFIGRGVVSYPVFTLRGLRHFSIKEIRSINWFEIIDEKCREREVKQKRSGRLYKFLVLLELLLFYLSIKYRVEKDSVDTILMWNGSHRYQRVISSLYQSKLRLVYFENGLLPNTTTCDFKGVNYLNSVPRDKKFYIDMYDEYDIESICLDKDLVPRKTKKVFDEIELPDEFIFVPFQDDRDTQIRNFSPIFKNMRDLYSFISSGLSSSDNVFVVKEHPSSKIDYSDLHYRDKNIIFANGNLTQELILKSKAVLTVN
ncbi:MAG: capsular biosynthesis protein, partial [Campylobacter sp.]|nr:capsular biosynthesis protein [Campylobacter sp.]